MHVRLAAQAYMCTERQLFGGGAAAGGGGKQGGGGGGKKRDGGGASGGGGADTAALSATQRSFAAFIAPHVPAPPPRLVGCACVFADCASRTPSAGPLRLRS
jgi:hypothetical protein